MRSSIARCAIPIWSPNLPSRAYRRRAARRRTFSAPLPPISRTGPKPRAQPISPRSDGRRAPRRAAPRAAASVQRELPTVRIIAARKIERAWQRRLVPADAPARALHHAQRHRIRARGKGVIGEFALARQKFGPGVKERNRRDGDARPRTRNGAGGRGGGGLR